MVEIDTNLKENNGSRLPFEVPKDYFDSFEAKMMSQIEPYEHSSVSAWDRLKPYAYMVASFLVLFFVGRQVMPDEEVAKVNSVVETNIIVSDDYDVIYSQIDEYALVEFALEENIDGFTTSDSE